MHFSNRHEIEEYLASLTASGAIVEIGCGVGNGLLALNRGNQNGLSIFGIDPYVEYSDPLGGHYDGATRVTMEDNTRGVVQFVHVQQAALDAVKDWDLPIGLLWVDLSMPVADLRPVLAAWRGFVVDGGFIGITGLSYSTLGTRVVTHELLATGEYELLLYEQNLVAVLKKNIDATRRAAFYIVGDHHSYANEAIISAESVFRQLRLPSYLFATTNVAESLGERAEFTKIVTIPERKYVEGWYLNQVWYFTHAVEYLKRFEQLLYLDTDTYVAADCSGVWRILEHYDMALGHAAGRGATPTAVNCPSEFATLGVGVNFFRNTPKMRAFFKKWLAQFELHYNIYGETDEGPMRDLLFLNEDDIDYFVLAPEEHCRFGFGVWLNGSVSILHGRVSQPLAEIAEEINEPRTMRLYRWNGTPGTGMLWYHVPQ